MYKVNIGLEIHAELKTEEKMFCSCLNNPDEKRPNINICPVCLGEPGALPVANQKAIKKTLKMAIACHSKISQLSFFERKNYFYPDLPKGYQISQFQQPIGVGGYLEIRVNDKFKKIKIREIHLEEDTAKTVYQNQGPSLINFNRSGVPLVELVTEPDICSAEEARSFAQELQVILKYIEASDANMEKGEMRIEANISLRKEGAPLGTKVEVKNLNSFRIVEKTINYEIKRQKEMLNSGKKIIQETRGWDEIKKKTFAQRIKEGSAGYRYFLEPDLLPFIISDKDLKEIIKTIIELPYEKRRRYLDYQISGEQINTIVEEKNKARFFEQIIKNNLKNKKFIKLTANYFTSDFLGLIQKLNLKTKDLKIKPNDFADLINALLKNKIQTSQAKTILKEMVETGKNPSEIIKAKKIKTITLEALNDIINEVLEQNQKTVIDFKGGKEKALQFLIGQGMKKAKGQATPDALKEKLLEKILKREI